MNFYLLSDHYKSLHKQQQQNSEIQRLSCQIFQTQKNGVQFYCTPFLFDYK